MDTLALIIGIATIVAFVVSLSQHPQPPVYQVVLVHEPPPNEAWPLLMAGIIALAMIGWLAAHL
jgi:H+/Cl- antiporter ClcA